MYSQKRCSNREVASCGSVEIPSENNIQITRKLPIDTLYLWNNNFGIGFIFLILKS